MNIHEYTQPKQLERYSFMWSEYRLVIAAIALITGGIPPAYRLLVIVPILYSLIHALLILSWIISGLASVYLFYRWNTGNKMLFNGYDMLDKYAFFVCVISGLNLGLAGLTGNNIGMSILSNYFVFIIVGILYLVVANRLWKGWKSAGERIF